MLSAHVTFHLPDPIGIDFQGHFIIRHDESARKTRVAPNRPGLAGTRGPERSSDWHFLGPVGHLMADVNGRGHR